MIYLLNYKSNPQNKTPLTKPIDLQSTQNPIFQTRPPWWTWRANQHRSQAQPLQLGLFYIIFASATSNSPQRKANLQPPLELYCFFPKSFCFLFLFLFFFFCFSYSIYLYKLLFLGVFWVWEIWKFCSFEGKKKVWFDNDGFSWYILSSLFFVVFGCQESDVKLKLRSPCFLL